MLGKVPKLGVIGGNLALTAINSGATMKGMDERTAADFLARLWRLQSDARLSDAALARTLGYDPSYICLLKLGRRSNPSLEFVMAAARRFPPLTGFLLPSELRVSNTAVPTVNDDAAPAGGAEGGKR